MNLLGNSLKQIAIEKAGIIKEKTPVLIGRKQIETETVFEEKASQKNTSVFYAKQNEVKFNVPNYQKENINTCISAIKIPFPIVCILPAGRKKTSPLATCS